MKIDKLSNDEFYEFASNITKVDVRLYRHALSITHKADRVEVMVYFGGEASDGRKFIFKDDTCYYTSGETRETKDLSFEWVNQLIEEENELTEEDINHIVEKYNLKIKKKIEDYSLEMQESLINLK